MILAHSTAGIAYSWSGGYYWWVWHVGVGHLPDIALAISLEVFGLQGEVRVREAMG